MTNLDHSIARELFFEIRERPYQTSTDVYSAANSCYFKNSDLLVGLGQLGYEVRGRTALSHWHDVIPEEIKNLADPKYEVLHFFIEVNLENEWLRLDASFHESLKKHGFRVYDFEHAEDTCFDLEKIYTQSEALQIMEKWRSIEYVESYFNDNAEFLSKLNDWFAALN